MFSLSASKANDSSVLSLNTEHWQASMKGMRLVFLGGSGQNWNPGNEIVPEPGNKERFDALLKIATRSTRPK